MYCDFHTHILPAIDDGAADVNMSMEMLSEQKRMGIEKIAATPHFYMSKQSLDEFIVNRNESLSKLRAAMGEDMPEIVAGAEVYFTPSLAELDLKQLCIGNTRYMMIELPYQQLSSGFIRSFKSFANEISHEITLILAHGERYLSFTDKNSLLEIMETDMVVQLNAGSFKAFAPHKNFMFSLIKEGRAHLLGSDCHNMTTRKPNMDIARKSIEKKLGKDYFSELMQNAEDIFNNKRV